MNQVVLFGRSIADSFQRIYCTLPRICIFFLSDLTPRLNSGQRKRQPGCRCYFLIRTLSCEVIVKMELLLVICLYRDITIKSFLARGGKIRARASSESRKCARLAQEYEQQKLINPREFKTKIIVSCLWSLHIKLFRRKINFRQGRVPAKPPSANRNLSSTCM